MNRNTFPVLMILPVLTATSVVAVVLRDRLGRLCPEWGIVTGGNRVHGSRTAIRHRVQANHVLA
jgi:hypothetical protein